MVDSEVKKVPRRGGRPSKAEAGGIGDKILDAATELIFSAGYGAVSIEDIARQAAISKRTFYARFDNKEAVFRAVVHRVMEKLRPPVNATDQLFIGKSAEEVLRRIAPLILHAALSPQALALQRTLLAEATRFPELAMIMHKEGAREEAIRRISELLREEAQKKNLPLANPAFLAEQFLQMLTSAPLRRAMGLGEPLKPQELEAWAHSTVDLFMTGCFG